ncbi:MAG: hypothetical protein K9G59_01190 [Caulobacter sp.]|nr:hypothetical protein [Caulobacter sp.]
MRRLLTVVAMVGVGMTGACERDTFRLREETQTQFDASRPEFEALADKVLRCQGLTSIRLKDRKPRPCLGGAVTRAEIIKDLKRLNLKGVHWAQDRTFVLLVNGEEYGFGDTPWAESGMIRFAAPEENGQEYALTPPPHYWFYTQDH